MKLSMALKNVALLALVSACTGQIPGSFRFLQQEQAFDVSIEANTKIDLLWIVDNSASMDVSQEKLRDGFQSFAQTYMNPNWDIRVAVLTTDAYIAHSAFQTWLGTTIPGSTSWNSSYIQNKTIPFVNPSWNPNLVNPATGDFENGVKYGDLVPLWGPNYAKLLPGIHDGPIMGLCFEVLSYFYAGVTDCAVRDDVAPSGVDSCVNPGAGEDSKVQCVNTIQNNSIRSGKGFIETQPPEGTEPDQAWVDQLVRDFIVNITTGSVGHGSERGLGSLLQLISDNETTSTPFFRQDSIRGVIVVSDEEDQTMVIPETPPAGFNPNTNYACDQAGLIALNPAANISGFGGYCCDVPANNCTYGSAGTTCTSKTVGSHTYTPSVCADPTQLVPVEDIKSQLDTFFTNLDSNGSGDPNYFVSSIVPLTDTSIQALQAERTTIDNQVGAIKTIATDRGDRYVELGNLVGNGSFSMDIGEGDYTPILNEIGNTIVEKVGTFTTTHTLGAKEEMSIKIIQPDGSEVLVDPAEYEILDEHTIRFSFSLIVSMVVGSQVVINYQPGANPI